MALDDSPAPMSYRQWQSLPDVRPAWHGGPWGKRWHEAMGLLKDLTADAATQAVRARWPSVAAEDALAKLGEMRGWPQIPGENAAEYRARLKLAWRLAELRGTALGIQAALSTIGLNNVTVREALDTTWGRNPYGYTDDQRARHFWVIVDQPHPFGTDYSFKYGDGTTYGAAPTGSGKAWGVNGDPRLFEYVRQMVRQMRPAHAYCEDIIVILSGTIKHAGLATDGDPTGGTDRVVYLGGA